MLDMMLSISHVLWFTFLIPLAGVLVCARNYESDMVRKILD